MLLQVKRINIIGVNTLFHQPPNNAQQDQQNDRVTRPIYLYNCVKYRSINDQKFNELKQKLTAAGFELDTEQVNRHSTGIANTSRRARFALSPAAPNSFTYLPSHNYLHTCYWCCKQRQTLQA